MFCDEQKFVQLWFNVYNVWTVPGPKCMKADDGEKYDNYLTKLQNICTETVGEEGKPVYDSVKSSIHGMSVLPTPTWTLTNYAGGERED